MDGSEELRGQREQRRAVCIRAVEDGDLEVFFQQQLDPVATRMAAFPARAREPFMTHWTERILGDPAVTARTAVADGEVTGGLVCWADAPDRLMVGYWYGRPYWGRGIATRALALFLGEVTVRPLYAEVAVGNAGSIRVLEKCGFRRVTEAGSTDGGAMGVEEQADGAGLTLFVLEAPARDHLGTAPRTDPGSAP
ncbi:MAG TPA: GNAT family N-acetyltransferase [Streptomyces sp.]|nr:GNAT family N-acetyltransferase [Streptomyces sp.]